MERGDHHHHHQAPKQQQNPSPLPLPLHSARTHNPKETDSPRNVAAAAAASDRLKRDEWSEGAVSSLLEAYEAKWTLRNRAKLKGHDWEDVAKHVSVRGGGAKSTKTQTQCKNKIESMKKRYRSESAAAADASSWPLYPRLDLLLRGNGIAAAAPPAVTAAASHLPPPPAVEDFPSVQPIPPPPPPAAVLEVGGAAQNSHGSNGVDRVGGRHHQQWRKSNSSTRIRENPNRRNRQQHSTDRSPNRVPEIEEEQGGREIDDEEARVLGNRGEHKVDGGGGGAIGASEDGDDKRDRENESRSRGKERRNGPQTYRNHRQHSAPNREAFCRRINSSTMEESKLV